MEGCTVLYAIKSSVSLSITAYSVVLMMKPAFFYQPGRHLYQGVDGTQLNLWYTNKHFLKYSYNGKNQQEISQNCREGDLHPLLYGIGTSAAVITQS
jgi:hypothetical protein